MFYLLRVSLCDLRVSVVLSLETETTETRRSHKETQRRDRTWLGECTESESVEGDARGNCVHLLA